MYCIYTREHFSLSKYDIFRQSWTSLWWLKTLASQPLVTHMIKIITSFLTQLHLLIARSSGLKCIELDHKREKCRQVFHFWKSREFWVGVVVVRWCGGYGMNIEYQAIPKSDNDKRSPTGFFANWNQSFCKTHWVLVRFCPRELRNDNWSSPSQGLEWFRRDLEFPRPSHSRQTRRYGLYRNWEVGKNLNLFCELYYN